MYNWECGPSLDSDITIQSSINHADPEISGHEITRTRPSYARNTNPISSRIAHRASEPAVCSLGTLEVEEGNENGGYGLGIIPINF